MTARRMQQQHLAFGIVLFIALEIALFLFVDRPVSQYLRTVDRQHPAVIDFFRSWTDLGKSLWYLWPSGGGALTCLILARLDRFPEARRQALLRMGQALLFFFACVAVSGIVTDIIKPFVGRGRPVLLESDGFYGFAPIDFHFAHNSFPSGHATTAFAVAWALMAFRPRWRAGLVAYALAVALSRVMVNAHFVSDVLAGTAIGTMTAILLKDLFRRRGWLPPAKG